jgi:L-malate glycosyltransferase
MKDKKSILIICPMHVGYAPSQRLKYEQYFTSWEQHGFAITVAPFMSLALQKVIYKKGLYFKKAMGMLSAYYRRLKLLKDIKKYDIVYIHLYVTPMGPALFESLVCNRAKKIIFDIDDLVFLKNEKAEPWYALLLKGRRKPLYLMQKAHHVITCTPYLDEFVRKYNTNTTDISSTINTETYIPVNTYSNDKKLVIGWSGSHSTVRMLETILPVFAKLKEIVDYKLLVMGTTNFKIEGIDVECVEWSEENEIPTLQRMDIGLYPLPFEDWIKGKSGLKALQYMALGLPVVATNIGYTDRVVLEDETGFLVTSHEQWVEKLAYLAKNETERKKMGINGRQRVEKHFSIKANEKAYLNILNNTINN